MTQLDVSYLFGGLVSAVWTLAMLYMSARFRTLQERLGRLEADIKRIESVAVARDIFAAHTEAWRQHLSDVVSPMQQRLERLCNGEVREIIERLTRLEAVHTRRN